MSYRPKFANPDMDDLFKAILTLKTEEECYRFFEDLCTIKEIQDMAQRMKVAQLLDEKASYQEIAKQTHASTATISRVNKALIYGAEGYHIVLKALKDHIKK
ncbi:MAG: TrpR-like protein YerC/YecD [Tenericutes bacterium HGW-Tenericutes-6]|nr:MAG: TrpR-like protein YerC/YecD [Tenericutes bacterium HGW-Tenericutes-6]